MSATLLAWVLLACTGELAKDSTPSQSVDTGVDSGRDSDSGADTASDTETAAPTDADGDGWTVEGGDCDDTRSDVNPGAVEVCDGVDNTCDGVIDEGVTTTAFADADGDGYGDASAGVEACAPEAGETTDATDCDDTRADVNPGALEVCDGADNTCDGAIDEGVQITVYTDADADGYGDASAGVAACAPEAGETTDATDCDDTRADVNPGAVEVCDGVDNTCDGAIDEGVQIAVYKDADGDGYGDPSAGAEGCAPGTDETVDATDCDDTRADVNPGAVEVCDGADNTCDGAIDEGVLITVYADADGDGFGDAGTGAAACEAGVGQSTDATDCDDTRADVNRGAIEVCDGVDNTCEGAIDEGVQITVYTDADGDGFGDAATGVAACEASSGQSTDATDCDDTRADVNPAATEVCDGVDNTCDGAVDEGVMVPLYTDVDGDGSGDPTGSTEACAPGPGQSADGLDCDDGDPTVYGGAPEISDCHDNDCDGLVDEDGVTTWYADADGDGHGDPAVTTSSCASPGEGWVDVGGDCDDTDPVAWTGAPEPGDGLDNDCDGLVDELGEPDFGDYFLAVADVASEEDGGYVVLWVGSDSSSSPEVVDQESFLAGEWISTARVGTDASGAASSFVTDVDGDGHADLFTMNIWADPYPYYSHEIHVYPWSVVTTRSFTDADTIAILGDINWAEPYGLQSFVLADGTRTVTYNVADVTWFIPESALADGDAPTSEAVVSVEYGSWLGAADGPRPATDFDGDGFQDALLYGSSVFHLFLADELVGLGLVANDAGANVDLGSVHTDLAVYDGATGDADGDGYLDVVGEVTPNIFSRDPACTAFLLLGPFSGPGGWEDVTSTVSFGASAGCGDSATLGDVDGDGADDFAFGMKPDERGDTTPGQVDVYLGATMAAGGELDPEADRYLWIQGEDNGDETGRLLYPADFDNDGVLDLSVYRASIRRDDGSYRYGGSDVWLGVGGPS